MNIYVSNLSFNVQDEDLREFFTPYGEVTSAKVSMDRATNKSRGSGFKKTIVLTSIAVLFLCVSAYAQVNTDSLAIVAKISEYQLKLGLLQNKVNQKTNDKQNDSLHAQQSATANATAANTLNANPQDKSDARQADRTAGQARGDARKARSSSGKLDDLNKEILDYQNKIAAEQLKLNKFTRAGYAPAGATTQPLPDSTQHP